MQTFLAGLAYCHPLPVNALIRDLGHRRVKVGVRANSKNEEKCCGVTRSQLPNRGLNTLPTVAESALIPEESPSHELCCPLQGEEEWNLPGSGLLPWGRGWLDMGKDSSPLRTSISLGSPHLLLCTPKATCFQYFCRVHIIPLFLAPLSTVKSWMSLYFFLDSLDVNWFCQHAEPQ